jgi:hypothetical protein
MATYLGFAEKVKKKILKNQPNLKISFSVDKLDIL